MSQIRSESEIVCQDINPWIDSILRTAWEALVRSLKVPRRCVVPTLTFERSTPPDYSHPVIQHLYILKYFPAYLFEYTKMYLDIFKKGQEAGFAQFNVLSLGCGCGLDFYGLHFAQKILGIPPECIQYCGIDPVNWQYQDIQETNIKRNFKNYGIEDPRIKNELQQSNVIVFPKSLSGGIPENAWQSFLRYCGLIVPPLPIIVAASIMSKGGSYDMEKLLEVSKQIAGQKATLEPFDTQCFDAWRDGILTVNEWSCWGYPNDIKDALLDLPQTCVRENICVLHRCSPDTCTATHQQRQPILNHKNLQYRITLLQCRR